MMREAPGSRRFHSYSASRVHANEITGLRFTRMLPLLPLYRSGSRQMELDAEFPDVHRRHPHDES